MNKTAIKNFAVSARKNLRTAISQKAYDIGVFTNKIAPIKEVAGGYIYDGETFNQNELKGRKKLIDKINFLAEEKGHEHGFEQVIEEVAYTWFNRLIALRFMEVNGFLPSNVRILSSIDKARNEPDCIREVESLSFLDIEIVYELLHDTDKLYRYILIKQCNALSDIMPKMFEKINDYTELLLPDRLYIRAGDIIYDLVHDIEEIDFTEQVEIIGWLYQYYNTEKKDEVFALLKKNVKIAKENIPSATQLFTPNWIVKYMVENSVGRLAVEKLNINPIEMNWIYYIPEAEQAEDVKIEIINGDKKDFDIKDLKVIDPCMGSGHILVYVFDVLVQVYEKLGYNGRDIPNLIFENNIYGLDIDERAGQLAYFALLMRARKYNRRFFRQGKIVQPKVYFFIESDGIKISDSIIICDDVKLQNGLKYLVNIFIGAKEYGSILKIDMDINYKEMLKCVLEYKLKELDVFNIGFEEDIERLKEIILIAETLTQKYDVIATNPPYMGGSGMNVKLSEYVKKNYEDSKSDLFAVCIESFGHMLKVDGLQAMITQHAFMFLSSYEKLRLKMLKKYYIINMVHLGARAFEEIGGEVVQTTSFVFRNGDVKGYKSNFVRLVDFNSQKLKEEAFLSGENKYVAVKENFEKIPGSPLAYWVSDQALDAYKNSIYLKDFASPKAGLATGDNTIFQRLWFEVQRNKIGFNYSDVFETTDSRFKWFPCNSGGEFRKWSTSNEYVVNWENNGYKLKNFKNSAGKLASRPQNTQYYFKKGVTWNKLSSSKFAVKYKDIGYIFDDTSRSAFVDNEKNLFYLTGFLCSSVTFEYLKILNPTMSFTNGDLERLPFIFSENHKPIVDELVGQNISISKTDWDSFETSWDFETHPLIKFKYDAFKLSDAFNAWQDFTKQQFDNLKQNEEQLNRIFIEIYGLQDELTPDVEDKDITIRKADLVRDIKSLISYAVGCMFGRYSLDFNGLIFAGGYWNSAKYTTFIPEENNILMINDKDYFDNDIVTLFVNFIKKVYGEANLDDNLNFIANTLYPDSNNTDKERIRRYFLTDFYKDHIKLYHKKPIYWLFDSGKQNAFKCLIYLHRYDKYTVAKIRVDYLHTLQRKYESEIKQLQIYSDMTETPKGKAEYRKQIEKIEKQLTEIHTYEPALAHISHQTIGIDLDDGVTANYSRFMGVDNGADKKIDLLAKI